jgi:hypothetical protein
LVKEVGVEVLVAGKRDQADVAKLVKDKDLGMTLIGAQDAAVGAGGGAAGIALSQAAGVFSTAVDKFGGVVAGIAGQSFMGSAAGGLVAGAGRSFLSTYHRYSRSQR